MGAPVSPDVKDRLDRGELAKTVADLVPAMLAYWDTSQRCAFANRAYEQWFGVAPETLVGMTMKELLGPIYPLNLPHIEAALRGEAQEFEREIPDPAGGPPRQALASYIPHVVDGVVQGFAVVVTNITQRKRLTDELHAARRQAEEALAQVRILRGLLPICAWCGKIRDDRGQWSSLESFLARNTELVVTHGLCEACSAASFPDQQE